VWGAQLRFEDYRGLWDDVGKTPWCVRHARFYVWVDERGSVLSSLKLYRPRFRVLDRSGRACVIGALFTPAANRNRGHASGMIGEVLRQARKHGLEFALLFSDIGTSYYEATGFRPLAALEQSGALPAISRRPAGWTLRPVEDGDLGPIRHAHDQACDTRPIAMVRDAEHWRFLQVRSASFFRRLGEPRLRQRFQVALRDGRFAGYLVTVEGRGEWNIREVGAVDGDPEQMAEILRVGAHGAGKNGLRRFYGWLPPELLPMLRDWKVRTRERSRSVPMLLSLAGGGREPAPELLAQAYLPFQDQF